jgi:myo-inositol 2-dehydrogenase/D-chiro-inositol 1-dehydrogenase/scyllo-inositol 2-dehydrogenase (NAD+)
VSDEVRILLAGVGRAGLVHGRNFAGRVPGGRLVAVADPSEHARERAATELGCERIFDDAVAGAQDEGVDAVVIASPTFAHAEIAAAALEAGKHVLCEKPLASSLDEAHRIEESARTSTGRFVMAFMRRFDQRFRRAAERIATGDIGEPVLVRATGRGPGLPPEWAWDTTRSGGLVAEVNSHDLDTIRWLSDQEFSAVYAAGRAAKRPDIARRFPGFVDVLIATFDLDGGGLAQLDGACPAGYGYDARVEVYGTEGTLLLGGPTTSGPLVVRGASSSADAIESWRDLFAAAYAAEDAHLVAVARGEEEPLAAIQDGVRALEAVVAVNRSMAEERRVPIDEVRRS